MLTEQDIHKAGRIDQVVRDYFAVQPAIAKVRAKDLMPLFVAHGIFAKDCSRPCLPIRNFLRLLDAENKLGLLKHGLVVRNQINRNWYFVEGNAL